jgi:enterochelin esterase-like enzyme
MRLGSALFLLAAVLPGSAQAPRPIVSPEVHADRSVTFRLRAPNAEKVFLRLEGAKSLPMQKNDDGIWNATIEPVEPDYYGYSFIVDGVNLSDPSNSAIEHNLWRPLSEVHVPGPSPLPWEVNDVPHGAVHHHFYRSRVVGDDRDFYVYTPPGYDPGARKLYPVLYLLHGLSHEASSWTDVGRAHIILDNLIAEGKAKRMIVVMPLGYGAPEILLDRAPGPGDLVLRQRNYDKFAETLLTEVMPQVENTYRVSKDRNERAIAGLSMGGTESLLTGLNNIDRFAWIGAFSSGGMGDDFNAQFPKLDSSANEKLHLLWIACGTDDSLIEPNRKFREWLKSKGVRHRDIETPGHHTWMLWRRNLAEFAPLLFQGQSNPTH